MEELKEIIATGRTGAVAAVEELMLQTFEAVYESMERWKEETGEVLTGRAVSGLSKQTLRQIEDYGPDHIPELVSGPGRSKLLMEFLNINSLRMKEFREKYPNAFVKWDAAADARLLEERRRGASLTLLAKTFGRNTNAIKIRLEHLGAGDSETADATIRYPSRPERPAGQAVRAVRSVRADTASPATPANLAVPANLAILPPSEFESQPDHSPQSAPDTEPHI